MEVRDGTALIAVSRPGSRLALRLQASLPGSEAFLPERFVEAERDGVRPWRCPAKALVGHLFSQYRSLVIFGSAGMAVRLIAPLVNDKHTDPAVVVVDDAGRFAVSLLSGHLGGANALAETVAGLLGAEAVVTTGSETLGTPAVDLLGREFGWELESAEQVTRVSAAVVNGDPVGLFQDAGEPDWWPAGTPLPNNLIRCESWGRLLRSGCHAALIITDRLLEGRQVPPFPAVVYRPRSLVVGVGCNRGTSVEEIADAVETVLRGHGLAARSLFALATVELKRDEVGLRAYAERLRLPIHYYSAKELRSAVAIPSPSAVVERWVGTPSVCESAALLASGAASLLVPKAKTKNVTVAVARKAFAAAEET